MKPRTDNTVFFKYFSVENGTINVLPEKDDLLYFQGLPHSIVGHSFFHLPVTFYRQPLWSGRNVVVSK